MDDGRVGLRSPSNAIRKCAANNNYIFTPNIMYLLEAPVAECISELTLYSSLSLLGAACTDRSSGCWNDSPYFWAA